MAPRRFRVRRPAQTREESSSESDTDPTEPEAKPPPLLKRSGVICLVLMLASSLAGHYYPILWMGQTQWHSLPHTSLYHSQSLTRLQTLANTRGSERELFDDVSTSELYSQQRQQSAMLQEEQSGGTMSLQEQLSGSGRLGLLNKNNNMGGGGGGRGGAGGGGGGLGGGRGWSMNDDEWQSVFVKDVNIDLHAEPKCKGHIPAAFSQSQASREPITTLSDLLKPKQRSLVFLARHGLGNSLRSFVSAYVYAQLSGRRLVHLHAAEHAKVYDLLCHSFVCGFDSIRWENRSGSLPMDIYRKFEKMEPFYFLEIYKKNSEILKSLGSEYPIFATRSGSHFDVFWHKNYKTRDCVYAAFKCSSLWCVHSRAMYAFVGRGGPSKELTSVISQVLQRHEPQTPEGKLIPLAPIPQGKKAVFDISVHLRTRTLALEKRLQRPMEPECQDLPALGVQPKYLRKCLWDCIGVILETLRANLGGAIGGRGRGLSILLATDDEAMRPEFVRRLEKHGTVFFSSGDILHTSKTGGSLSSRLPTMAEFFLMAKAHTLIEAGSYISTFAYFSSLVGNGTLAGIQMKDGGCRLRLEHKSSID